MAIKKQEFYEGAALYLLARTGRSVCLRYEAPFFVINDDLFVYLKYSTKCRSPWGFTFTTEEQFLLQSMGDEHKIVIGLVCGADGVAAFRYESYRSIAAPRESSLHIACYRRHREHYEVNGPDGCLDGKVARSNWLKMLET
jgi:hypothetical protein